MGGALPGCLQQALRPITVVVGHYGAGKTNFCMNLAVDAADMGKSVTVIDLDIVNPYFRASEQRDLLEEHGIRLIAPVYAQRGTNLDVPSLTGQIEPAIQGAGDDDLIIVDAGGDDAGATALGRYARDILQKDHAVLYVANRFRNMVQDYDDALVNVREIEAASHLSVTAMVNNSHLKAATTAQTVEQGMEYAHELATRACVPLACTTVPNNLEVNDLDKVYPVASYIKDPWG